MKISFDCWKTLIKGNPKFKKAKNDLIRSVSDIPDKELLNDYFIEDQISQLKVRYDSIIEVYGTQPNILHLFADLCSMFSIPERNLKIFYSAYQALFQECPPLVYSPETIPILDKLHADGHEIYFSSNTLFTGFDPMMKALLEIGFMWNGAKFSGELGVSKPNVKMFFPGTHLHVGDNVRTDGACVNYGIEFFQINTNDKTITDLYEHVSLLQESRRIHAK